MLPMYEELDFQSTPIGDLMLRRRRLIQLKGREIYEIKLGESFLMTSLFHEAEVQLSLRGLSLLEKKELDIVVGGLGLGYTAANVLKDPRVKSLVVIEYLEAVIKWHAQGLVPLGKTLTGDPRCQLINADFFEIAQDRSQSFDPAQPSAQYDAILLDIDHSPTNVLHQTNQRFYSESGLKEMRHHLKPDGVFGLWADGFPEASFTNLLIKVFGSAKAHTIRFDNPLTGGSSEGTVYLAKIDPKTR